MVNDGLDRGDRHPLRPSSPPAIELITGRQFEDNQIDAPTITPPAACTTPSPAGSA